MKTQNTNYTQSGFAILESLIAFIVLAVGLLVLINFNNSAVQSSGDSRARLEAMTLAQAKMQNLRSFLDNDTDAGSDWLTRMASSVAAETINGNNATYSRTWTVTDNGRLVNVSVDVAWVDRDGADQNYTLTSEIYDVDPTEAAKILHAAILGTYDQSIAPGGEDDGNPDTSDLDTDNAPDTGTWNASTDLGLTDCGAVACSTINYYYRLTISGEVDKSGNLNVILPDPQVSTADSSGAVCDFGNTTAYKQANKTIAWNTSTQSIKIISAKDPDGVNILANIGVEGQTIPTASDILYINSNETIDAPLSAKIGDYSITYKLCGPWPAQASCGANKTVAPKVTLNDGYYICYAYFQEQLDGDSNHNGVIDAGEVGTEDGNYGWTGKLSFTLSSNNAVFCLPITGVSAPSGNSPVTTTAFGQLSFDKSYEKITTNQSLFIQIAGSANVCPSQL